MKLALIAAPVVALYATTVLLSSSTKGYNGGNGKQGEYMSEEEAVQNRPANSTGE